MSWLVVFTTVIVPLLLVVLPVMDLVELDHKPLQFPSHRGDKRTRRS